MIRVFLILTAVLCLLTTCCDDCEDCPVCPEPEAEEHLFYIAPKQGNMVKIFSVEQEAFIDSLVVDSIPVDATIKIHIIGDDSLLAASVSEKTYIIDLATKGVIGSFEGFLPTFSRNSRFYACFSSIYKFPEHEPIHLSTEVSGTFATFCNRSESMSYWGTADDHYELGLYFIHGDSLWHKPITWHGGPPVTFFMSYPVSAHKKTFIEAATYDFLGVCDFDSDTLRKIKSMDSHVNIVPVVSPDDKYVFFTDFTITAWGYFPSGRIFVWSTDTEDSIAAIAYQGIDMAHWLIISHDSRYLVAPPYNEYDEYTTFCLIDAKTFEVIGVYECGFLPWNVTSKYCARNGIFF
jgi:hypothetical protein